MRAPRSARGQNRWRALGQDGPVLELAIGTGRVAIPLAERGLEVHGIDLSEPMVDVLHRKLPGLPVTVGDIERRLPPGQTAVPFDVSPDHVGFDTYDPATQEATSHHYTREPDGSFRNGEHHFRYVWPSECDLMARLAGMELERRSADWRGSPFTADSEAHVSVWRRPVDARG